MPTQSKILDIYLRTKEPIPDIFRGLSVILIGAREIFLHFKSIATILEKMTYFTLMQRALLNNYIKMSRIFMQY